MPAHQPHQERHVVADGTEPVSDGVEPVEAQQVERHGAEPCQHLKALVPAVFHRDQEVGATLLEVEEKGRLACNASDCTSSPSSSTRSSSWRSAAISPPASVA